MNRHLVVSQKQVSVRPQIRGMAMTQYAHSFFANNLTQLQTSHSIHSDLFTRTASPTLVTPLVLHRSKKSGATHHPRVPRTLLLAATGCQACSCFLTQFRFLPAFSRGHFGNRRGLFGRDLPSSSVLGDPKRDRAALFATLGTEP